MKLVVGLGNPGEKYKSNRHNIGFVVVDELVRRLKEKGKSADLDLQLKSKFESEIAQTKEFVIAKPVTFMNEIGRAVSTISHFYKLKSDETYIIHDDLDIPLGKYKIQHGKGPQVHNGLLSVERELGTDQYWNVRIGVENREVKGNKGVPGVVYSLQDFESSERETIDRVVEEVTVDLLTRLS